MDRFAPLFKLLLGFCCINLKVSKKTLTQAQDHIVRNVKKNPNTVKIISIIKK